jgi:glycopeptide antibiotics resistance protein
LTSWLRRVPLWIWWIPIVWIVSFPVGLTSTPQWERMHALPFTDPADKLADLTVNLLLFVPFGYSLWRWSGTMRAVLLGAVATSVSAELPQLFSTIRYPSGTDVVSAAAGAMLGAVAAACWQSPSRRADVPTQEQSRPSN